MKSSRLGFLFTCFALLSFATIRAAFPQDEPDPWKPPASANLLPHFENIHGRQILYVEGQPFSMLGTEIPWWDLRAGHYHQDQGVYDDLYPKARELGMNTLKVPVKWSMVEPEKDHYEFAYVEHALHLAAVNHLHLVLDWFGHYASGEGTIYENLSGELYAPMYVVEDEETYPRAVDGDGVIHHNAASYDSGKIVEQEVKAFRAFMQHLKQTDTSRIVAGIQLENEIAVFGSDRHNPKLFREHSAAANKRFAEHGFTDDLKYSAWDLSTNWIGPLSDAGQEAYPIPIFHNYVGGTVAPWMVGGAPGEDVKTYLDDCPAVSFIALNAYFCGEWRGDACFAPSHASTGELRAALQGYAISRNIPAVTETNSGASAVAARFAYLALGEFGVPIFSPWSLTMSYPESNQPYVLHDGRFANGADGLKEAYLSLEMALPQILLYAGTDKLAVFQAAAAGERFSETRSVNGLDLHVEGAGDGQAIVIHPAGNQFLIVGYRASVSLKNAKLIWPTMKSLRVQRVHWNSGWAVDGEPLYGVNQSDRSLSVDLDYPQAVLVSLPKD